jgi:hypothetical protein
MIRHYVLAAKAIESALCREHSALFTEHVLPRVEQELSLKHRIEHRVVVGWKRL